jgi:hypothetical protein
MVASSRGFPAIQYEPARPLSRNICFVQVQSGQLRVLEIATDTELVAMIATPVWTLILCPY